MATSAAGVVQGAVLASNRSNSGQSWSSACSRTSRKVPLANRVELQVHLPQGATHMGARGTSEQPQLNKQPTQTAMESTPRTYLLAATVRVSTVAPRMTRRGSPCPLYAKAAEREGRTKGPAASAAAGQRMKSRRVHIHQGWRDRNRSDLFAVRTLNHDGGSVAPGISCQVPSLEAGAEPNGHRCTDLHIRQGCFPSTIAWHMAVLRSCHRPHQQHRPLLLYQSLGAA